VGGEAEVCRVTWDEGAEGVYMGPGYCHIPSGMVLRGGERQSIC